MHVGSKLMIFFNTWIFTFARQGPFTMLRNWIPMSHGLGEKQDYILLQEMATWNL